MKRFLAIIPLLLLLAVSGFSGGPDFAGSIDISTLESSIGNAVSGRAVTATLHVSPSGDGTDGSTWAKAYTTIQSALDAASTDANDCTLIMIAPHATAYDIYTTGNPTWTGNYEIVGTHRIWAAIKNTHGSATSVMKFTGKVSLQHLAIFQTDDNNSDGVIITGSGFRIRNCGFNSESIDGAATSICIDGTGGITSGGIIEDVQILGDVRYTTGLHINKSKDNEFRHMHIHKTLIGIEIDNADSDCNFFEEIDIGECATGIYIDDGNEQLFNDLVLHDNATANIIDDIGDSTWNNIQAELDVALFPDNFVGITVATGAGTAWTTSPVEIRSAVAATVPFKVVATLIEGNATEKFRVRFSHDSGATWFDDVSIEGASNAQKREAAVAPTATDHIFNAGTQIVAASKSESGGNSVVVWLEIQEF